VIALVGAVLAAAGRRHHTRDTLRPLATYKIT
jgi:hypothetical protein